LTIPPFCRSFSSPPLSFSQMIISNGPACQPSFFILLLSWTGPITSHLSVIIPTTVLLPTLLFLKSLFQLPTTPKVQLIVLPPPYRGRKCHCTSSFFFSLFSVFSPFSEMVPLQTTHPQVNPHQHTTIKFLPFAPLSSSLSHACLVPPLELSRNFRKQRLLTLFPNALTNWSSYFTRAFVCSYTNLFFDEPIFCVA